MCWCVPFDTTAKIAFAHVFIISSSVVVDEYFCNNFFLRCSFFFFSFVAVRCFALFKVFSIRWFERYMFTFFDLRSKKNVRSANVSNAKHEREYQESKNFNTFIKLHHSVEIIADELFFFFEWMCAAFDFHFRTHCRNVFWAACVYHAWIFVSFSSCLLKLHTIFIISKSLLPAFWSRMIGSVSTQTIPSSEQISFLF